MGMHFGILAARCPWDDLRAQLAWAGWREAGELPESDPELLCGEHDGRSYVVDLSMIASSDGDLVVALSEHLKTLVIGCGAETDQRGCSPPKAGGCSAPTGDAFRTSLSRWMKGSGRRGHPSISWTSMATG